MFTIHLRARRLSSMADEDRKCYTRRHFVAVGVATFIVGVTALTGNRLMWRLYGRGARKYKDIKSDPLSEAVTSRGGRTLNTPIRCHAAIPLRNVHIT